LIRTINRLQQLDKAYSAARNKLTLPVRALNMRPSFSHLW
jgi:hypothetical protein